MSRRWVVNASPIILLAKVRQLTLLSRLCDEWLVPEVVLHEVGAKPEGKRVASELAVLPGFLLSKPPSVPEEIAAWDLGPGESQVLAEAARHPNSRAVLDDREARRCAASVGVPVIGTLGIVLRAQRLGILRAARPVIAELRAAGMYVADDLAERALRHLGE